MDYGLNYNIIDFSVKYLEVQIEYIYIESSKSTLVHYNLKNRHKF